MDQNQLDDIIIQTAENATARSLDTIIATLRNAKGGVSPETAEKLEVIWGAWNEEDVELEPEQCAFVIEMAALGFASSAAFRMVLTAAVRTSLPPYLNRSAVIRALGLRDDAVAGNEVIRRYRKLLALKTGCYVFRGNGWGTAGAADSESGTVPVTACNGRGSSVAVPLESILKEASLLGPGLETSRIIDPAKASRMNAAAFRAAVKQRALCPVSENQLKAMAQLTAAAGKSPDEFNAWWSDDAPAQAAAPTATRTSSHGRSLEEIEALLDREAAAGNPTPYGEEDIAALTAFFTRLRPETAQREALELAKVVSKVVPRVAPEQLAGLFAPVLAKAPFWPKTPENAPLEQLAVWGHVPAKELGVLADATIALFDLNYLIRCVMRLPLKSLNAVCAEIDPAQLDKALAATALSGADILLWVWKNHKKLHLSPEVTDQVNVENVVKALSQEKLPREWGAAQRELKLHLLEKSDFHQQMIDASGDDPVSLTGALQSALFLNPGERQSLLVKLARHSAKLRDHIENGAGQQILNAGLSKRDKVVTAPVVAEPNYTSVKSHQRLLAELNDLINVQIPENREALKVARAHGDFRENAEFDAAKERRNFLRRRREELERELANLQPVSLRIGDPEGVVQIGTVVTLRDDAGAETVYTLLGAWDGDPERNFVSYRTRLGQAIYRRAEGDRVTLPNGKDCVIAKITALPEDLLKELE